MHIEPTELFSALAHETRVRCLMLLWRHSELCVCELTAALGVAQPHVSRHLGVLRELGLVADRREGLWIFYRIQPLLPDWVNGVITELARGVSAEEPYASDELALMRIPNRPAAVRCG